MMFIKARFRYFAIVGASFLSLLTLHQAIWTNDLSDFKYGLNRNLFISPHPIPKKTAIDLGPESYAQDKKNTALPADEKPLPAPEPPDEIPWTASEPPDEIHWTAPKPPDELPLTSPEPPDEILSTAPEPPDEILSTALEPYEGIPSTAPKLPADYYSSSEAEQECKLFFTPAYLEDIAKHQLPYCTVQSQSSFDCLLAARLRIEYNDYFGDTIPLCVAQGVSFNPESGIPVFGVQCKLRDLRSERATSTAEAAEALEGFADRPHDFAPHWGSTGVTHSLQTWEFDESPAPVGTTSCTQKNNSGDWIMLVKRDDHDTQNLWHKLMEILQARHSLDALRIAINPATGAPWLSSRDAENVQLVIDDDREELLQPLWQIVTGKKPVRLSSLKASSCLGSVILPLPGSSSPFWSALLDVNYRENCPSQTLLTTYVRRVFDFYGIEARPKSDIHKDPTITIVDRKKNRKFFNLARKVTILRERYPDSPIHVVDFANMTVEAQLRLVQSTDILVGHHGAAMSHIIFMAPESTAVEILPRMFDQHGFRALAAMSQVTYIAGRDMFRKEYNHAVHGEPLPKNWPPKTASNWQFWDWAYLTDEDFVGLVDAAVRTQRNRLTNTDETNLRTTPTEGQV